MSTKKEKNERKGLTTVDALNQLHDDINEVLKKYEINYETESWLEKVKSALLKPYDTPMGLFPFIATIITIISLYSTSYIFSATILLIILCFNTYIVIHENNLRKTEIYRKVRRVLDDINVAKKLCKDWTFNNYPHLCSPLSPCVTLQWTYRDNHIVNLPWALLVRGDYIVLRPGQVAPGTCSEINGKRNFKCGETYGLTQPIDPPLRPTARLPLPDLVCEMEITPYLDNLRTSLENFLSRPATISNQQRYLMITQCIQQWGLSIIFLLTIIAGGIHYSEILFFGNNKINWIELFIEIPIITIIPTLPLIFPVLWIFTNLWGIAKLQTLLSIPQPNITSAQNKSFQEDLDTPTFDWEHIELSSKQVFFNWIGLIKGNSDLLGRSANIVQVLGSVTALCCVDKKGILSWPNPTAEKVFFLHDSTDKVSKMSSQSSLESDDTTQQRAGTTAEVLDLTHDQHSPFKLEFDDHEWKNHINSLKPLGLAILVNTCCPLTQAYYAQFCGHVTAVAMLDKDLVPVTNRYAIVESSLNSFMHGRCLCELAKQIGFTPQARDIFNLEGQIASYKHLQPEVVRRDIRFARQLQLASKVKVPFPHSLSVVMRESHDGSLQLLTQGTADLVLDCCDDYWDGKDLRPLGQQERKRAQDFYQRSALTAYCTAFAYRPLRHGIRGSLSGINTNDIAYLELPPEAKYQLHHVDNKNCNFDGHHSTLNHSISTDSLLFSDIKEDDIADVEGCYEMQCHQVFIGMVTMQYQAQTDIVQLIERLDNACIRFVHFSKENELRSRVFSEKMGLESGWNCHISLLSEDHSILPSPKSSHNFECTTQLQGPDLDNPVANIIGDHEMSHLLSPFCLETSKTLSSSAPGAISDQECYNSVQNGNGDNLNTASLDDSYEMLTRHRSSRDSAMDCHTNDEKYRSISCLTDSTEQSAPVHFDMSNRAKLPRGIENIQPHLENVDNVPLLVSLFTDCSAEATREMLNIMQQYGEIVVCIGSSSSNSNAEIFLQADCSIAVEPLYPQVCQDYPSYNESNIYNNHLILTREENLLNKNNHKWFKPILPLRNSTISPIYLSRMLNSISCSIAVCRDDPLSIVSLIELSRRFTTGLWNCIQFWSCCTCTLVLLNFLASLLFLPIMLTPISLLYLMCIAIPLLSVSLSRTQSDPKHIMNRATGKKQTKFNSRIFIFVLWSYGCKFIPPILIMILSYCAFMSHPITILNTAKDDYEINLKIARIFIFYSIVVHFVIISISFVHRESLIWQKNPFTNHCWLITCCLILFFHTLICLYQVVNDDDIIEKIDKTWPVILFLLLSIIITFSITELCKWEEIKVNVRYQRRARLDFGTKLGMNSPF